MCHVMLGFRRFGVSLNWLHSTKKEWRPNADRNETFWPGENNLYHRKARGYTRRFAFSIVRDRSFLEVIILDRTWPVWSCEMTCFCLYVAGRRWVILFVDFESHWLLDVNRGNSHISWDVGFILITLGEFILSVSSEGQNWIDGRVLKPRPIRVS